MGIKTADMVKGLPGKEITADVDWLGILDSFDPSQLEKNISTSAPGETLMILAIGGTLHPDRLRNESGTQSGQ